MFEFQDDKLGKVKVINVTEARASIASIMGDKDSNYVITKNNRPIRVIVNYDFFRQVNFSSRSQKPADTKGQYPKDPVKGLLQSKTEELKKQMEAAQQRRPDLFPPTSYFNPSDLLIDEPSEKQWAKPVQPAQPAELAQPVEPVEPAQDVECGKLPYSTKESTDYLVEEIPEPPSEETITQGSTTQGTDVEYGNLPYSTKEGTEKIAQAPRTPPPRGDYFDSYRKLYETPRYQPLFQTSPIGSRDNRTPRVSNPRGMTLKTLSNKTTKTSELAQPGELAQPVERKSDIPSIQDLLSEIEGISLSPVEPVQPAGEEEQQAS